MRAWDRLRRDESRKARPQGEARPRRAAALTTKKPSPPSRHPQPMPIMPVSGASECTNTARPLDAGGRGTGSEAAGLPGASVASRGHSWPRGNEVRGRYRVHGLPPFACSRPWRCRVEGKNVHPFTRHLAPDTYLVLPRSSLLNRAYSMKYLLLSPPCQTCF